MASAGEGLGDRLEFGSQDWSERRRGLERKNGREEVERHKMRESDENR